MRRLARLVAAAGLVLAGGLALPGGAAQAAACPGSTGVTVVIDKGSSSTTSCAPDTSSAMAALQAVASVTQVQTQPGFICQINGYPNTSCVRTPPASAYWAFFHAPRGGSWTYSSSGAGGYDPPTGSVIGFAFGSGGAPSSAPPGATAPTPKPSPSSSSSRPPAPKPAPKPTPKPAGTTPARPGSSGTSAGSTPSTGSGSATGAGAATGSAAPKPGTTPSATAPGTTTTAPAGGTTTDPAPSAGETTDGADTTAAAASATDSGSPVTLLAGLGLVGLVGAAAAYLTIRRRTTG